MYSVGSLYHDLYPEGGLASNVPISNIASDTTTVGATIDALGFAELLLVLFSGTLTDGDYDYDFYHGDESDMSDEAAVASSDIIGGSLPDWEDHTADDNKVVTVAVRCRKRYFRIKIVSTNTSSGGYLGAIVLKGRADNPPVQS